MLQRLRIALAYVKAGNTYENLINEIRQTIYSLYYPKNLLKIIWYEFNTFMFKKWILYSRIRK